MPTYTYACIECDTDLEKNVPIKDRDEQWCERCGLRLNRTITFTGLTWAPTAGGMR